MVSTLVYVAKKITVALPYIPVPGYRVCITKYTTSVACGPPSEATRLREVKVWGFPVEAGANARTQPYS